MKLIDTNPMLIRKGDIVNTGGGKHKVQAVTPCESKPECVHIDHECYDARFSTVKRYV